MNEQQVKDLIIQKYGSINAFSESIDIANSTVVSILDRGFLNAKLKNVFAICRGLGISPEDIDSGFEFSKVVINGNNNIGSVGGDINGNISLGSTLNKDDLHEVANNLNLTDRELQEKTLREVSELKASQARLENAIALLIENQAMVLANMKSVDKTFKDILESFRK